MKYLPVIIVCLFVLVCVAAVYGLVRYLQRKTREVSRTLFGTESLTAGVEQMKKEYASTPKSVSAMTSLLLPKITSDFPDFHYDEMRERAENVLLSYLRAVSEGNKTLISEGTQELEEQTENHIQMMAAEGLREKFTQARIHRTEISQYRRTEGRCTITFQSALECFHYIEGPGGEIKTGSRDLKYQTKFNVDVIYIQDRNLVEDDRDLALGVNCPNCGAALSGLGAKKCEYCGTPVVEFNIRAWHFSNVEEVK